MTTHRPATAPVRRARSRSWPAAIVVRPLVAAVAGLALLAPAAGAAGRLGSLSNGMHVGVHSPEGAAQAERSEGRLSLRYLYLTGGTGKWTSAGVSGWLAESARTGMTPVLTDYQLQSSARRGTDERSRIASALDDRTAMGAYWRDVRRALQLAGAHPRQLVVLQVEPDGWEFMEQLRGERTPARVGSSGLSELRGLPDDVRGFARAFVRLRDRYAPNVALGWHLSAWGVGQAGRPSVANSENVGRVRAAFLKRLGAHFDVVLHDPGGSGFDDASFARHLALLRTFYAATHLPLVLFQVPTTDGRVDWLLGEDARARAHLAAEKAAGVIGMLFDGGDAEHPTPGRWLLLRLAAAGHAAGLLAGTDG